MCWEWKCLESIESLCKKSFEWISIELKMECNVCLVFVVHLGEILWH